MFRKPPRSSWMSCLPFVLGLLLVPTTGLQAQDMERLRQQVQQTDGILERARDVVETHGHPRARQQLRFALQLQESARNTVHSPGASSMEMRRAAESTLRARDLARRAVQIASQQARLQQRALNTLEVLERRIEEARSNAGDPPDPRSLRTLELAERRLEQAREAFHEQRFQEVVRLGLETRRFLDGFVRPPASRHVERMLENTSRLLETSRADLQENSLAQEPLLRAEQLLEQAEATWLAGRLNETERLVRQARELVLRAMRAGSNPPERAHVDLVLEETATFVNEVAQQVRNSQSSEVLSLIESSRRHLERARALRLEERLKQALEEARVARNLAYRASQLAAPREP